MKRCGSVSDNSGPWKVRLASSPLTAINRGPGSPSTGPFGPSESRAAEPTQRRSSERLNRFLGNCPRSGFRSFVPHPDIGVVNRCTGHIREFCRPCPASTLSTRARSRSMTNLGGGRVSQRPTQRAHDADSRPALAPASLQQLLAPRVAQVREAQTRWSAARCPLASLRCRNARRKCGLEHSANESFISSARAGEWPAKS